MELYKTIQDAIRPICASEASVEEAAMNIYLTATGVRPASLPFDVDGHDVMMAKFMANKEAQTAIREIPNIIVRIGPYFDSGDVIVVANKGRFKKEVQPILNRLENMSTNERASAHIFIGKLLGYVCPTNISNIWNEADVDDISFIIDGVAYMGVWCPRGNALKNRERAQQILADMNRVLEPLGKTASLDIHIKSMNGGRKGCHTRDRKRKSRRCRKMRRRQTRRC